MSAERSKPNPKPLRDKLGLSAGRRNALVDAPNGAAVMVGLSDDEYVERLNGSFGFILVFTRQLSRLRTKLPVLKQHLDSAGALWVSWPKGRGQGSDVTLRELIKLAYDAGLVESKTIALDMTWSSIKLTWPKPGKVYRNSYGRLPKNTVRKSSRQSAA